MQEIGGWLNVNRRERALLDEYLMSGGKKGRTWRKIVCGMVRKTKRYELLNVNKKKDNPQIN